MNAVVNSIDGAETLWRALHDERPLAARLALLSCLPVRVSPAFLRLARLRLLRQGGTADEADLWLSDLVETRSSAGFSYRRGVRDFMRRQLAGDEPLLQAVWQQVHLEHAPWLAPRSRLEEELTWRLLCDPNDAWIEQQWRAVLGELESGPHAEGVARWVVRAVVDLPEGSLLHESGRRAFYGAHLLLGDASVLGEEAQTFLQSAEFAFATRRLPRRRVFVGRIEHGVLISPIHSIENGFEIDVPATRPLWFQVEDGGQEPFFEPAVMTVEGSDAVPCVVGSSEVTLRLIDGSAYSIGPVREAVRQSIARNRIPRVQIEYDVELYGALKKVQLPFVTGVLADLGSHPGQPLPPVAERKFREYDADNFDSRMKEIRPRLAFRVPDTVTGDGTLSVDLSFESIDDFSPGRVARKIGPLAELLSEREQLANLVTYMDGKRGAEELVGQVLKDASFVSRSDLAGLVAKAFRPKTEEASSAVELAVRTLARHAQAQTALTGSDVAVSIETLVAQIDMKLSAQMSQVLHRPEFQQLESAWCGLRYLVNNTETNEMLKIRVLNISKGELSEDLRQHGSSAREQSAIFKKVYEEEFGQFGGEPFGCLVGDFYFSQSPADVDLLQALSKLSATAFVPFIAAADPALMQMSAWQELASPRNLSTLFATPEYAAWRALRDSDDARFLGLAMPRFLARLPYGSMTNPVEEFNFEEDMVHADTTRYVWANAAYAMATNISRSFKLYGWCARIRGMESGGAVENLPTHSFPTDDGGVDTKCPTEIAISDRREAELAKNGLMPLVHRKNTDLAIFFSAQSLHKPPDYDDADATANANLAARWPYLFATCRFVHYLKCIVRDKVGSFRGSEDMARWLNDWIRNYVDGMPETSSEETQSRYPLAAAEVVIDEVESEPGYYSAKVFLRPHYQLDGLTVSLRVVTRLPSAKAA